jgi:Tol biopolymer transport system component
MRTRTLLLLVVLLGTLTVLPAGAAGSPRATNGNLAFAEESFDAPGAPRLMTVAPLRPLDVFTLDVAPWTDVAPSWSPDGRRIAFARALEPGLSADIWTVDGALGDLRAITDTPARSEGDPTWAPDGRRLAFTAEGGIWILDIATEAAVRISQAGVLDEDPAWSPRGDRIAFSRGASGERQIYVVPARPGATARRITFRRGDQTAPSWSPDAKSIAWSNAGAIWVMRGDGRKGRRLTSGSYDFAPSWSPDGRRIAFQRTDPINEQLFPDYIWTMDPNGGGQQRLVLGLTPDWGRAPVRAR